MPLPKKMIYWSHDPPPQYLEYDLIWTLQIVNVKSSGQNLKEKIWAQRRGRTSREGRDRDDTSTRHGTPKMQTPEARGEAWNRPSPTALGRNQP